MLGLAAISASAEQPVTRQGPPILHYSTRNDLTAGNGSSVVGTVSVDFKEQGKSQAQSFALEVSNLKPGTEYTVVALINDDPTPVYLTTFVADSKGEASLTSAQRLKGKSKPGRSPWLTALDPVVRLNAISILQGEETVAYTWINDSSQFQYLVKRNLTDVDLESEPRGSIHLKGNPQNVNFRLRAGGLIPGHEYQLFLNGVSIVGALANESGVVQIMEWPQSAPAILDLRLLELRDGNYPVLRTILPK